MTARLRLLVLLARPSVLLVVGLFTALGLAQAGSSNDPVLLAKALLVVLACVLVSVIVNDLADREIDRINLPEDPGRPLAAGTTRQRSLVAPAGASGLIALAASTLLHRPAVIVVVGGLGLSLAYSLRPVRIADRGALASLLLPAGYVAVPYLLGIFAVRGQLRTADLLLGGGLYLGFIGRILLKDFRDVRGDALFGKRTFLVRHGRGWTCAASAVCWLGGTAAIGAVRGASPALVGAYVAHVAVALVLLRALADERGARRDEWLISAVAIVGRGAILVVLAHLAMVDARWSVLGQAAVLGSLTVVVIGQAWVMARIGPVAPTTEGPSLAVDDPKELAAPI